MMVKQCHFVARPQKYNKARENNTNSAISNVAQLK